MRRRRNRRMGIGTSGQVESSITKHSSNAIGPVTILRATVVGLLRTRLHSRAMIRTYIDMFITQLSTIVTHGERDSKTPGGTSKQRLFRRPSFGWSMRISFGALKTTGNARG